MEKEKVKVVIPKTIYDGLKKIAASSSVSVEKVIEIRMKYDGDGLPITSVTSET